MSYFLSTICCRCVTYNSWQFHIHFRPWLHFCDERRLSETTVSCFHLSLLVPTVKRSRIQRLSPFEPCDGPGAYHLNNSNIGKYLTCVKLQCIPCPLILWIFTKNTDTLFVLYILCLVSIGSSSVLGWAMAWHRIWANGGHVHQRIYACCSRNCPYNPNRDGSQRDKIVT